MSLRHPLRRQVPSSASWTAAVERYRRAVDRYHANRVVIPNRALRQQLEELGESLEAVLEDFEDAAAQRGRLDKAREEDALACIHRAATLCAHATEATCMANDAAWHHADEEAARCLNAVRDLVRRIGKLGDRVRPAP